MTTLDRDSSSDKTQWSTSEVAKALGVSPSLVRTWIAYMAWEVRRNAEGHRVFSAEDVAQLEQLKAWLDAGHTLKAFRRERQGDGPYDPRLELRTAYKRLKEIQSQEEALFAKHHELLAAAEAQRAALAAQLVEVRASLQSAEGAEAEAEPFAAGAASAAPEVEPAIELAPLREELAAARAEAATLRRQLARSEAALAETESVEPYQRALAEAEIETASLRSRVSALQAAALAAGSGDELAGGAASLKRRVAEQEAALAAAEAEKAASQARLEALAGRLAAAEAELPGLRAGAAAAMMPSMQETSMLVQGVLKQLLSALLEKRGKLQFVRRYEEQGRAYLEFAGPGGRRQIVEDMCATAADQRLLETLLTVILSG